MTEQKKYNTDGKTSEDRALDLFADMMIERIKSLSSKDGWKKPWFTEGSLSWPKNLSGREYNGMNALMLMMHCEKNGYKLPIFCTFDRVAGLNFTKDKQGKRQQAKGSGGMMTSVYSRHTSPFPCLYHDIHCCGQRDQGKGEV